MESQKKLKHLEEREYLKLTVPGRFFPKFHHSQLFLENSVLNHSFLLLTKQSGCPVQDKNKKIIVSETGLYCVLICILLSCTSKEEIILFKVTLVKKEHKTLKH